MIIFNIISRTNTFSVIFNNIYYIKNVYMTTQMQYRLCSSDKCNSSITSLLKFKK